MEKTKYNNIIISRLMGIGDTIMLTPLLQGIKKLYPDIKLTIVTETHTLPLTKRMPFIDEALAFEKTLACEFFFVKHFFRNDMVYCVDNSYRISLVYALAMIKERIGFPHKRGCYLTRFLQYEPWMDQEYEPLVHAKLFAGSTGIDVTKLEDWDRFYYPEANEEEKAKIDRMLADNGLKFKDYIVCSLESDTWQKDWPIDKWLDLFEKLKEIGKKVVVLGVKSKRLNNIVFPENIIDFRGGTTLVEMGYVVQQSELMISVSSLFVHVANAFDIPLIALYGSQLIKRDAPPNIFAAIKAEMDCAPCSFLYGKGHMCENPACMNSISADRVFAEAYKFYGEDR